MDDGFQTVTGMVTSAAFFLIVMGVGPARSAEEITGWFRHSRTAANASATTLASIRVSVERDRVTA